MTKKRPKIAFVYDWIMYVAGGERLLLILHELYPEAPIYTSLWNPATAAQVHPARIVPSYLQRIPMLRKRHYPAIPLMPHAFESFNLAEYDVVVTVGAGFSKGVITGPQQRHISYCFTPIRYVWNLAGDNRNQGALRSWIGHYLRHWDFVSAQRVDEFVTLSHTVAARIQKIYRRSAEVVYPPVNTDRYQILDRKPEYFLSVSRLITYKRVDIIVQACLATRQPLVVVGVGPEEKALRHLARQAPWIRFTGHVPDDQMQELYSGAKACLFAAEEDFGIVPVEAMSAGRPVIAFARGGATETVVAGRTGLFFPEQAALSLQQALDQFDAEAWDSHLIREHALQFDAVHFKSAMSRIIERD